MTYVAQLGRRLDRPVINLGFSGLCHMEPALADLLAELDPAMFVIDCLPNMPAKEVAERREGSDAVANDLGDDQHWQRQDRARNPHIQ